MEKSFSFLQILILFLLSIYYLNSWWGSIMNNVVEIKLCISINYLQNTLELALEYDVINCKVYVYFFALISMHLFLCIYYDAV